MEWCLPARTCTPIFEDSDWISETLIPSPPLILMPVPRGLPPFPPSNLVPYILVCQPPATSTPISPARLLQMMWPPMRLKPPSLAVMRMAFVQFSSSWEGQNQALPIVCSLSQWQVVVPESVKLL